MIGYLHRRRESILEIEHVNEMPAMDAIAHFSDRLLRELSGDYGGRAYLMLLAASVADASSMRVILRCPAIACGTGWNR